MQRAVALKARRPGVAGDLGADRGRPGRETLADGRIRAEAPQLTPQFVAERLELTPAPIAHLPGVTSSSWSGSAGSMAASVAVIERLPDARDAGGEDAPPLRVELGEHVVEQEERREAAAVGDQLRLGEEEREHREPLLALRAEAAQLAARRRRGRRRRGAGRAR